MTGLTPGYWCECTSRTDTSTPQFRASFDAASAHQAVRWIRVALRTVAAALHDEPFEQAWHWITHDYRAALQALTEGSAYELTLTYGNTATTWTARRVLFLPLAHRQGHQLPPCAEEFAPHRAHGPVA